MDCIVPVSKPGIVGDLDTLLGLNRYCFCLNWPQVSSDQQQINTIENKCSWSTDFLLCWVTSIYLVSSLAQPGHNVFVCRAFKVNSQLTLSFLRGPDCTMAVMESSIQGVKIIVLHLLAHRTSYSYLIIFMWIIGIVGMYSIAHVLQPAQLTRIPRILAEIF